MPTTDTSEKGLESLIVSALTGKPVSGTGSAGMEGAMYNVAAPGEEMAAARDVYVLAE